LEKDKNPKGKTMKCKLHPMCAVAAGLALASVVSAQAPLGTAVTYQGQLKLDGQPVNATADFQFTLWDAESAGNPIGAMSPVDNVTVADGLFTVEVNANNEFGGEAFNGEERWLEIAVRSPSGQGQFTTLAPRQNLTAAPNSLFALNASTATDATLLNGQPAAFYQNASNLDSGTLVDARLDGTYSGLLTLSNVGNAFTGAFSGSGAGLTDLNASSISQGLVAPAFGGTGLDTSATTMGSMLYTGGLGTWRTLDPGADSQVLTLAGGVPTWANGAGFALPYSGSVDFNGSALAVTNSHVNGMAIAGYSTAEGSGFPRPIGVYGESTAINGRGVVGDAPGVSGIGVGGSGGTYGVFGSGLFGVRGVSVADGGRGVYGDASGPGQTYGGYFEATGAGGTGVYGSSSGTGVFGTANAFTGSTYGVYGLNSSSQGTGVFGEATAATGSTYGGRFVSNGNSGTGVSGTGYDGVKGDANGLLGVGVWGTASGTDGIGVYGVASDGSGSNFGGYFVTNSTGTNATGVFGQATAETGTTYGVWGQNNSTSGYGVIGINDRTGNTITYGVYGRSGTEFARGVYGQATAVSGNPVGVLGESNGIGWGLYALGNSGASGVKAFRIDHPDDPANKYLLHYSTESPEVLNAYSGKVMLDGAGEAVVELPHYFAKINKDPRYTLTAVGAPMPMLHVAEEIDEAALSAGENAEPGEAGPLCSFRIAGGAPGGKVSWRVEALRNDRWVQNRGAPVEVEKQGVEKGTYQHPELYNQAPEMGMNYRPESERPSQLTLPDATLRE